jgi:hypothetical protein
MRFTDTTKRKSGRTEINLISRDASKPNALAKKKGEKRSHPHAKPTGSLGNQYECKAGRNEAVGSLCLPSALKRRRQQLRIECCSFNSTVVALLFISALNPTRLI